MYAEILAGPIKIYRAVVGSPEPLPPSDSPPAAWTLVSDNTQYTKDGLNVAMTDERDEIEVMNKLYPIKEYRTSARKKFEVKLKDMKIETLALLLGNPMIQTDPTATMKGYRRVSNEMSFIVAEHALLVVGHSPYDDEEGEYGLNYWAPRVHLQRPRQIRSPAISAKRTKLHDQYSRTPDPGPWLYNRQLHPGNSVGQG